MFEILGHFACVVAIAVEETALSLAKHVSEPQPLE